MSESTTQSLFPRVERAEWVARATLALVPTFLFLDVLAGMRSLYLRDIAHYYYPAKKVLREIVLSGHFPYWNPYISAGQPMAANPQHEVFYPLTWLILLPGYDVGFHLLVLVHVYIALFAMYALLRSMKVGRLAAVLGAISYGLGGLMLSTLNLFPCLFSMSWLPLTCLYTRKFLFTRTGRDFALAGFFLAMQLLIGEPATALQTGLLLGIYAIVRGGRASAARNLIGVALISGAAVLVAAVQILPAIDHFGDSVRGRGLDLERVRAWSMPPLRVGELIFPELLGDPVADRPGAWRGAALYPGRALPFYFSVYVGLLMTVAAMAGLLMRSKGWTLAATILAVSILLAIGSHTPLLGLLHHVGVGGYLRYPEKFIFMATFALIVFGARSLQAALDGDERVHKSMVSISACISIAAFLIALVAWPQREEWFQAVARSALLCAILGSLPRVRRTLIPLFLGAFVLVDLAPMVFRVAPRVPKEFYLQAPAVVHQFPERRDDFRIFHHAAWDRSNRDAQQYFLPHAGRYWAYRNALVPLTPGNHGLRTVLQSDYDATSLLPTEDLVVAMWQLARLQPRGWIDTVAAMSNVRYVGVFRPFRRATAEAKDVRDIQPVAFLQGRRYPRYYFASQIVTIRDGDDFVQKLATASYDKQAAFIRQPSFTPARGVVHRWSENPNAARIEVETFGRAFLIMSVTPHKYWRVTLDGNEARPIVTNLGYQGMVIPRGRHTIEMSYSNPLIAVGAGVSIAALIGLTLFITMRGRPRQSSS